MTGPFCNDVDIFSTYEISQGFERTLLWIRTVDYICRGDAYMICRNFKAKCVGYLKGNKLFQFENIYGAKKTSTLAPSRRGNRIKHADSLPN